MKLNRAKKSGGKEHEQIRHFYEFLGKELGS
jgi:hypothetical protein